MTSRNKRIHGILMVMRPRQWIKNSFVLAPLLFSGAFVHEQAVFLALLATLLFCLASSATYIFNDIIDIEADRQHPTKSKSRPLASGLLDIRTAIIFLIALYTLLAGSYFFMPETALVVLAYILLNILYSLYLKHQPVIDIFSIAASFVLRVYAGAVAIAVPLSAWMFITTLCLALFLASIKRRQELILNGNSGRNILNHYSVTLVDRYAEISATGTLVFYSLYVMSNKPEMIITIPFVLFGLFRYWFLVESKGHGESPTNALLKDWQMLLTIAAWIASSVYAMHPSLGG